MTDSGSARCFPLDLHWRSMATGWAEQRGLRVRTEASSLSVDFGAGEPDTPLTMQFTTSSRYLVVFTTNSRNLKSDELARGAAVANAWNTEQLVPVLSVWNLRGERPHLAGVCNLPLACRLSPPDFAAVVTSWAEQAEKMFAACQGLFGL
jgi:hypothetical protein